MRVTRLDDLKLPKMRMIEQRLNVLPPVNVPEEIDREWNRLINSLVLSPGLKEESPKAAALASARRTLPPRDW